LLGKTVNLLGQLIALTLVGFFPLGRGEVASQGKGGTYKRVLGGEFSCIEVESHVGILLYNVKRG
jgi:hypothetical protein